MTKEDNFINKKRKFTKRLIILLIIGVVAWILGQLIVPIVMKGIFL